MSRDDRASRRTVLKSLGATGAAVTGVGTAAANAGRGRGRGGGRGRGRGRSGDDTPGRTELTILHDTHTHGRLENDDEYETVEHYFGLMEHLARDTENALMLANGDDLGSSAYSIEFEGQHTVDTFNAGPLSHDTYGNHDFDFGPETLLERVSESEFLWVSANVDDVRTGEVFGQEQGAQRYDIVDVDGVGVGITGILTERAREVSNLGENARVRNPTTALQELVPEMRAAGAKVIVVLSHVVNTVARDVARNVSNLDVIVGDDASAVEGAEEIDGTIVSFVGDEYEYLGEITLDIRGKSVHSWDFTMHEVNEAVQEMDVDPHAEAQEVADSYRDQVGEGSVIGETEVPLNALTEDNRTQETNLGNFIADTVRETVDADVAIQNGGGIRSDTEYEAGEVTDLMIQQILPFGNVIVSLNVTGETLLEALENGVSLVEEVDGRFPQVSGMSYTWDPDAEPGNRIVSAQIDGEDVDPDATYTLGTNAFLADGGDGYEMFADYSADSTGDGLAEAVTARILRISPIDPEVEGRIERGSGDGGDTATMVEPTGILG